jgi:hypothetical protein
MKRAGFLGVLGSLAAAPAFASASAEPLRFVYASGFWLNLHHRLYVDASLADFIARGNRPSRPRSLALLADRERLPSEDRRIWDIALQSYIDGGFLKRSLLFDDGMTEIKEALTGRPPFDRLTSPSIPDALRTTLLAAAPVYERTAWIADDLANRAWIEDVRPRVAAHGAEITRRLAGIYRWAWPLGEYRVDVVRYMDAFNAYTTCGPIHIVIDSSGSTDTTALEMLFHEASHAVVVPDAGTVGTAIENAATFCAKREPADLWHGVIFFTTGSVVAQTVFRATGERYTMYADAVNLWIRGWSGFREPLARFWQPYIDGHGDMQGALTATVRAIVRADPAV